MKKSRFFRNSGFFSVILAVAALCPVLSGCDNFLSGGDFKEQLGGDIDYAKAKNISVQVSPKENTGLTDPLGKSTVKQGYPMEISFSEAEGWNFVKWIAVSESETFENGTYTELDGIVFDDACSAKTSVTVTSDSEGIRIMPLCTDRIAAVSETPKYNQGGVARDSAVTVEFSKEPAPESFIFTEDEILAVTGLSELSSDVQLKKKAGSEEIWAYEYEGKTYFKNIEIRLNDRNGSSAAGYFKLPVLEGKRLFIEPDGTEPLIPGAEGTACVWCALLKDIHDADGVCMSQQKEWSYLINSTTGVKALLNFSFDASSGKLNAVSKEYSILEETVLNFEVNQDWQFIEWDYDSSVVFIKEPENPETAVQVRAATEKGASSEIKAVCVKRPRVSAFSPAAGTTAVGCNTPVELTLNCQLPYGNARDELLQKITLSSEGVPVTENFFSQCIDTNLQDGTVVTIIGFTADPKNMIRVSSGSTRTVTVSIPADFYYLWNGKKIEYGASGISYSYTINDTTVEKAYVTVTCTANSGSVTSAAGYSAYSLGQEVPLVFEPAEGWAFSGWSMTHGTGNDPVPVDDSEIKIEDKDSLSTSFTVYKALSGVAIKAEAYLIPSVTETAPQYKAEAIECDTPVRITFNKPVQNVHLSASGTVQITDASNEYEHYEKYFSESGWDGNTFVLTPKNTIRDIFADGSSLKNLRVRIDYSRIKDTEGHALQKDPSWVYRVNYNMETVGPEVTMTLYKPVYNGTEETDERLELSAKAFSEFSSYGVDDYSKNHIKNVVYFDASASDSGSGYKQLTVKETLIRTVDDTSVSIECSPCSCYTGSNLYEEQYDLKSEMDGVVQLDFIFEDNAGNTTVRTWYVIKDTILNSSTAINAKNSTIKDRMNVTTIHNPDSVSYIITETLDFSDCVDSYYQSGYRSDKCTYSFNWGYKNEPGSYTAGSNAAKTVFTFNRNAEKDCWIKISAFDSVGNSSEIIRIIPKRPVITGVSDQNTNTWWTRNNKVFNVGYDSYINLEPYGAENFFPLVFWRYKANENDDFPDEYYQDGSNPYTTMMTYQPNVPENFRVWPDTFGNGIYEIYMTYCLVYNEAKYYYGPFSEPYTYYYNYTPTNSTNTPNPSFPSTFTATVDEPVSGTGVRTVHVTLPNSFKPTDGFYYGVYVTGSGTTYAGFDFSIKSGTTYTLKLFAINLYTRVEKISSVSRTIDLTYDNIPPVLYSDDMTKNDVSLVNLSFPDRISPLIYDMNSGMYYDSEKKAFKVDYYVIKQDNKSPACNDVLRSDLDSLKNCSYTDWLYLPESFFDRKNNGKRCFIDLGNNFIESYYHIVLDLEDTLSNRRLYSFVVSTVTAADIPRLSSFSTNSNDSKYSFTMEFKKVSISTRTLYGNGKFRWLEEDNQWYFVKADNSSCINNNTAVVTLSEGKNNFVCAGGCDATDTSNCFSSFYTYVYPAYELMTEELD